MTTEELTALQDALAKMTPGEWQSNGSHVYGPDPKRTLIAQFLYSQGASSFDQPGIVALVNAAPALLASAARAAELEAEVAEWRECMQFDALMSGPVFKGWDRSQMERCRKKHEARAALKEPK